MVSLSTGCKNKLWCANLAFKITFLNLCLRSLAMQILRRRFHLVLFNKGHVLIALVAIFVLNEHGEPVLNLQLISKRAYLGE
jgi:hypothetical protein